MGKFLLSILPVKRPFFISGGMGILICCCFFLPAKTLAQEVHADFSTADDLTSGCGSFSVHFIDKSTGGASKWEWDLGNGQHSQNQNPKTVYTKPGTYTVTLVASNGVSSDTHTMIITVYEPPAVNFTLSPSSGCYPLNVKFDDNSQAGTGDIAKWTWDFGDGSPFSTDQNPTHLYTAAGKFNIKLSVTNSAGCENSATLKQGVITNQGITVDFTADDTASCTAPMTVNFTATTSSEEEIEYHWDFGDGQTGTGKTATHTYTHNANYTVTLTASVGGGGCKDQVVKENYIHVGTYKADFEIPKGCANIPLTFKNTSSPLPRSAIWKFEDGTTKSGINVKHAFSQPGTYKVTLVNDYDGCQQQVSKSITTYPSPKADFAVPQSSYCDTPATVTFQNLSTGATSWKWTFGDERTSTEKEPAHLYQKGGDFDIKLIATNDNGCVDSVTKQDFIKIDAPNLKFNATNGFGCFPLETTFELPSESIDRIQSYHWDFGDPESANNTSTAASPTHTYKKAGAYTVTLTVVTKSGCKLSFERKNYIHVGDEVEVRFDATPKETCVGTPVKFTNQSQPAGKNWTWIFPNDGGKGKTVEGKENPTYQFSTTGSKDVILQVNNNGCISQDTAKDLITVKEPVAGIKRDAYSCTDPYTIQFHDASTGAQSWHWDFGDGDTSNLQNPSHTYRSPGARHVFLTVRNGECANTADLWVQVEDEDIAFSVASEQVCKGNKISLTADNIKIPEFIGSLIWKSGDGAEKTTTVTKGEIPKVEFTYDHNGSYTPSLIVKYRYGGCRDTLQGRPVTVHGPTAAFSMSEQEICQGNRVSFTDESKPDPADAALQQWVWDYGDGSTDTATTGSIQHDFTQNGTFNIRLTVTDAKGCSDRVSDNQNNILTVNPSKALFSTPDTLICPGTTLQWDNNSEGNIINWKWDFGDGNTSADQIPEHFSYSQDSTYTVKLFIETDKGCKDSLIKTDYIKVGKPLALMKDSSAVRICRIFKDTAINLSKNYSSILWDFGDGTTASRDTAYHIYNIPGTYTQKLIVNGYSEGCQNTAERKITVTGPIGEAVISDPAGCFPHTVHFSAKNVSRAVRYQWYFGNGDASQPASDDKATYTYQHAGIYHPILQLTDDQGCDVFIPINDTLNVIVDSVNIKPAFSWPEICDSNKIKFDMSGSVFSEDELGEAPDYVWDFGDPSTINDVSNDMQPVYRYPGPGVYYPTLKINTAYNCTQEVRDTVTIPDSIALKVNATVAPGEICVGDSILLKASSNIGTNYTWMPSGDMKTPDSSLTLAWPLTNSTYKVVAFSNGNCQTDTTTVDVIVHDNPEVTTDSVLNLPTGSVIKLRASGSPDITSWKWTPPDYLDCTTCTTPTTTPRSPITYVVTVMNQFGCTDSASVQINLSCAEGKVFIPNTFTPNNDGMNDIFYPRGLGVKEVVYFRIYNRWGQLVYERTHFQMNDKSAGWKGRFKGRQLPPGVFVYQAEMICDTGKRFKVKGDVTLIR